MQETRLLILRNVSTASCTLHGRPSVSLLDRHGSRLPFIYRDEGDQMLTRVPPRTVLLRPGRAAYAAINKNACVEHSQTIAARMLLTLPGAHRALTLGLRRDPLLYCNSTDPGHTIEISPFESRAPAVFDR
jgi:hypothetical protein